MKIKDKIVAYIEQNEISKEELAGVLGMNIEKFMIGNDIEWSAGDLLEICNVLGVNPMEFYEEE